MNATQRGIALLTALLIVAITAVLATTMVENLNLDIHRAAYVLHGLKAQQFAAGAEIWAQRILQRDPPAHDTLQEPWALPIPSAMVDGGEIGGRLEDLQGRFNLNNLITEGLNEEALAQFQRLLEHLELPPALALATADWLDQDADARIHGGMEDDGYLLDNPPYRAANHWLRSPGELRLVSGMTEEAFQRLLPHVSALPPPSRVNVNTATVPVLYSLHPEISQSQAERIHEQLREKGAESLKQAEALFNTLPGIERWIAVNSRYFALTTQTEIGGSGMQALSVLYRADQRVAVIFRSYDGW